MNIKNLVSEALGRRNDFSKTTEIFRFFSGASDGIQGIIGDKFGCLIVVTIYNPQMKLHSNEILDTCKSLFPAHQILIKIRNESTFTEEQYSFLTSDRYNVEAVFEAKEKDRLFEIRCDPGHDFGIFTDAFMARERVQSLSQGKNVLNLFSYACGFGVAAGLGKALQVTNVDPSRDYLTWGKRNAALNKIDFRVLPDTAQQYLKREIRRKEAGKGTSYDLVVLDPPAFGVGRGNDRLIRKVWPELLDSLKTLSPQKLILLCNDKSMQVEKNFVHLLEKHFGTGYSIEQIAQHESVTGKNIKEVDQFYVYPRIFEITLFKPHG